MVILWGQANNPFGTLYSMCSLSSEDTAVCSTPSDCSRLPPAEQAAWHITGLSEETATPPSPTLPSLPLWCHYREKQWHRDDIHTHAETTSSPALHHNISSTIFHVSLLLLLLLLFTSIDLVCTVVSHSHIVNDKGSFVLKSWRNHCRLHHCLQHCRLY